MTIKQNIHHLRWLEALLLADCPDFADACRDAAWVLEGLVRAGVVNEMDRVGVSQ